MKRNYFLILAINSKLTNIFFTYENVKDFTVTLYST